MKATHTIKKVRNGFILNENSNHIHVFETSAALGAHLAKAFDKMLEGETTEISIGQEAPPPAQVENDDEYPF